MRALAPRCLTVVFAIGISGCSNQTSAPTITPSSLQIGTVAQPLTESLAVVVRLPDGYPVVGANVTWAALLGEGSVSPTSAVTDLTGRASARWTLPTKAGSDTATAAVVGLPPVSFS